MNWLGVFMLAAILASAQPSPTYPPLSTQVAPTPIPIATPLHRRACAEQHARVGNYLVIGLECGRTLSVTTLSSSRLVARKVFPGESMTYIATLTNSVLVVDSSCGSAAMRNCIRLLRLPYLKAVGDVYTDTNVLGVLSGNIYLDDWCCGGRPSNYQPATIFTISTETGKQSSPFDLYPDQGFHEVQDQLLGQGENNYMIGKFLYVVVDRENIPIPIVYRYDLTNLRKGFVRMRMPPLKQ